MMKSNKDIKKSAPTDPEALKPLFTSQLYHIFCATFENSLEKTLEYQKKNAQDFEYWTHKTIKKEDKKIFDSEKFFKWFLKNKFLKFSKKYLESLKLIRVKDTPLIGFYKNNFFDAFSKEDYELMDLEKENERNWVIASFQNSDSPIQKAFLKFCSNFHSSNEALDDKEIIKLFRKFRGVVEEILATENSIDFTKWNGNDGSKIFLRVKEKFLGITKEKVKFYKLTNETNSIKPILKLNFEEQDLASWDELSINKEDSNYSILKEFITSKTKEVELLAIALADLLVPNITTEMAYQLIGDGGTGKSSILELLRNLIENSERFVSEASLNAVLNNHFEREPIFNYPIILTNELSSSTIKQQDELKVFISRQFTSYNRKFLRPITIKPIAKYLIASNETMKTIDTSGLNRRLAMILFDGAKVRQDLDNKSFKEELLKDKKGLFAFVVKGVQALIEKKWNYEKIYELSNRELLEEFAGTYSPLAQGINLCFKKGFLKYKKDSRVSLGEVSDFLYLLSFCKFKKYSDDNLSSILESYNNKSYSKRNSISKWSKVGIKEQERRLNRSYGVEEKTFYISKLEKNETKESNVKRRYRGTILIENVSWDFKNEEFFELLTDALIDLETLDKLSAKSFTNDLLKEKFQTINANKQVLSLIWIFHEAAPEVLSANFNRFLEFNDENLKTKVFKEKEKELKNVSN